MKTSKNKLIWLISETLADLLRKEKDSFGIDITSIPIETLKMGHKDFRLVPHSPAFGDPLSNDRRLNEALFDILPADETVRLMKSKYLLPDNFIVKKEYYNLIAIYIIVSQVGINSKLIEDDMLKLGYFLGDCSPEQTIDGMTYKVLRFEPLSKMQDDVTNAIKERFEYLYHWTPSSNVMDIARNGLLPMSKNSKFKYPPRIYLIACNDNNLIDRLGEALASHNIDEGNEGYYTLLSVSTKAIDKDIRLFKDPISEIGLYTEQAIPSEAITIVRNRRF